MRKNFLAACVACAFAILVVVACSGRSARPGFGEADAGADSAKACGFLECDDGGFEASRPCDNLECKVPTCEGGGTTTVSGKVFDPAGRNPLYNVVVYIPNSTPAPITHGATCDSCGTTVVNPVGKAVLTNAAGEFTIENAPAGPDIPLVVQVGKWRRQLKVNVLPCQENTFVNPLEMRLPRNQSEGDMPKMALSTGGCDPFGCLFSRMGIDALEFTAPGNGGAIEVFEGVGGGSVAGGGSPKSETSLWNDVESLKKYDVVLLSCECSENDYTKSNANKEAMKQYLDLGGRVFATHFHYTWFKNGPSDLAEVANWNPTWAGATMMTGTVDQSFPKGKAMAEWLLNVGASTAKGSIVLSNLAHDVSTVNSSAQRWIATNLGAANESVKYFSFNTPIGKKPEEQCGRGVMSDLHVSNGESDSNLPSNCTSKTLTAQEKALEFLLFDLSSCIQNESEPPKPPK